MSKSKSNVERLRELSELIDDETDTTNVVPLRLITGGKGPSEPSEFWLQNHDVGTNFLCRNPVKTGSDWTLVEYYINHWTEDKKACVLTLNVFDGQPKPFWVDPVKFSGMNRLFQVLKVPLEVNPFTDEQLEAMNEEQHPEETGSTVVEPDPVKDK